MTKSLLILLLSAIATVWLFGQEPPAPGDPFSETKEAPKAAAPSAGKKNAEEVEIVETDPIVLGIRESKPKTPNEVMQAVINLVNYGRPDEAKRYMTGLMKANLNDAAKWRLHRDFGSAVFLRISRQEDLQPEGNQLADSILSGSNNFTRDPARLDILIKQLSNPALEVRQAALTDLLEAREEGVVALIGVLGDPARSVEHATVRAALRRFGSTAVGPLLGALEVPNDQWRTQVVTVLGSLQTIEAIPFLLRPYLMAIPSSAQHQAAKSALSQMMSVLPTKAAAERYLHKEVMSYLAGRLPGKPDHENLIEQWKWDAMQNRPIRVRLDTTAAPLLFAARLGAELTAIAPENATYRQLYLTAALESAKFAVGWDQPLPAGAGTELALATAHVNDLEDVLRFALAHNHMGAAIAAIEILGATGDPKYLQSSGGQPREVTSALRNPNRRVRFAALQAIYRMAPQSPYAGASFVPETIGFFARTAGTRRILIAHPRSEISQTLAGICLELGIDSDLFITGNLTFQAARRNSDYELVLLSDAIELPNIQEQVQQFRRDPLTAKLPIGVLARAENFERLQRTFAEDSQTEVFAQPTDEASVSFVLRRLLERTGRDFVSHEERMQQASFALEHWADLASKPELFGFYELLPQQPAAEMALTVPELTAQASRVLGLLANQQSQRALLTLVNQSSRPLSDRQVAAAAFGVAVHRRGILLTKPEILQQYQHYNQSKDSDAGTQQVLGAVLDALDPPKSQPTNSPQTLP